jgi:hypothetical protein
MSKEVHRGLDTEMATAFLEGTPLWSLSGDVQACSGGRGEDGGHGVEELLLPLYWPQPANVQKDGL